MKKQFLMLLALVALFPLQSISQDLSLPVYKIEINREYLDELDANPTVDTYYPATFTFDTISYSCEVRYRGKTSRELPKKSWKVSFDDNQTIFSAEKLNLNAEYRDKSIMRNYLIMKLYKYLGYPASEVEFINLFVNDEYMGVYVQVEQVDEDFFEKNNRESGNLFKAVHHGANMSPLLRYENYETRWEPKITDSESYSELQELLSKFYFYTKEDFNQHIPEVVNIDNFINYFALEYCVASTDCFTKNFYLNYELQTQKYELYPWDNDGSLGNRFTGEWTPDLITTRFFYKLTNHVFYRRIMENEEWRREFSNVVGRIVTDGFSYLHDLVDSTYQMIRFDYYQDPEKACTNMEFEDDIINLHTFLEGRATFLTGYSPLKVNGLYDISVTDGLVSPDDSYVKINIKSDEAQSVYFNYVTGLDITKWGDQYDLISLELFDDGNHNDSLAGDLIYGNILNTAELPKENIPVFFKSGGNLDFPHNGLFQINFSTNRTITYTLNNTNSKDISSYLNIREIYKFENKYCVEIANEGMNDADISFCFLNSGAYYNNFPIPDGTLIPPGGSIIVSSDISFAENHFRKKKVIGNCFFDLADNDTLRLLSPTLNEITSTLINPVEIEHKPYRIVINEINYNSSSIFDTGDWVELYNPNAFSVDLSAWVLKDSQEDNSFIIDRNITIPPDEYLVICNRSELFSYYQPSVDNFIGDFEFKLNGSGDEVRLYDSYGILIDSVCYDDKNPWPIEADGMGKTLELKNPDLDNCMAENWTASSNHGSPGKINSNYNGTINEEIPLIEFSSYPNPFSSSTTFTFNMPGTDEIDLSIFNATGVKVQQLSLEFLPGGPHSFVWAPENLNSGIYFAVLRIGNKKTSNHRVLFLKQ